MIGYIKGYNICNVTKKSLKKEESLNEIKKIDSNIKEEMIKVLDNKGYIYGLKQKNILKAVYLFDNIKENGKRILKFNKCIFTKDTEDKKEEFEKAIIEELKEKVAFESFSNVDWNDIEISPDEGDEGISIMGLPIGLMFGVAYGIIFGNLALGILFGTMFGLVFRSYYKKEEEIVGTVKKSRKMRCKLKL